MKKLLIVLFTLVMTFTLSGCKKDNTNQKDNLEGTLEEILNKIYTEGTYSEDFVTYTIDRLETIEVTKDICEYFFGTSFDYKEAIASEPLITSKAYSLCLVRVNEDADIEKIKTDIKENVNPNKWVCVGVDPSNVIVDNIGDVIILIMSNDETDALHNAFLALAK